MYVCFHLQAKSSGVYASQHILILLGWNGYVSKLQVCAHGVHWSWTCLIPGLVCRCVGGPREGILQCALHWGSTARCGEPLFAPVLVPPPFAHGEGGKCCRLVYCWLFAIFVGFHGSLHDEGPLFDVFLCYHYARYICGDHVVLLMLVLLLISASCMPCTVGASMLNTTPTS
jgi:hypothetical protein